MFFRDWCAVLDFKCPSNNSREFFAPVLRFAQKNLRYRFRETFLKVCPFPLQKRAVEEREHFLKKFRKMLRFLASKVAV